MEKEQMDVMSEKLIIASLGKTDYLKDMPYENRVILQNLLSDAIELGFNIGQEHAYKKLNKEITEML